MKKGEMKRKLRIEGGMGREGSMERGYDDHGRNERRIF